MTNEQKKRSLGQYAVENFELIDNHYGYTVEEVLEEVIQTGITFDGDRYDMLTVGKQDKIKEYCLDWNVFENVDIDQIMRMDTELVQRKIARSLDEREHSTMCKYAEALNVSVSYLKEWAENEKKERCDGVVYPAERAEGDTEVNEYIPCIRCQMGFLPHQLTGAGLCQECNEKHSREAFDEEHALCKQCAEVTDVEVLDEGGVCSVCNVKNLLEDIINEFGHKDQVLLSMDRIKEMYNLIK